MADEEQHDPQELIMQLRYLQNVYSQQYEALDSDITTYTMATASLQRNIELLEKKADVEGSNVILGGDGGAYISAKVNKAESVMVYVGAGYLIDKSVDVAKEFLRSNLKKSEDFLNRLVSDRQKVERELMDISIKMNALQSQQDGPQG